VSARGTDKDGFAELAKKNSEDALSVENGGDLGVVARGALEAPLEEAAFNLTVGDVSDVVESSRGMHIIRLEEKVPGGQKPLAEVHDDILKELRSRAPNGTERAQPTSKPAPNLLDELARRTASVTPHAARTRSDDPGEIPDQQRAHARPGAVDQVMDPEPPYYLFQVKEKVASDHPRRRSRGSSRR
jgi:hypothetical protein